MESIGVRELRQHASRWLERVAAGESFRVTDRGTAVALLTPIPTDAWDELVRTGAITPASDGSGIADLEPLPPSDGVPLSELLAEDRDAEGR